MGVLASDLGRIMMKTFVGSAFLKSIFLSLLALIIVGVSQSTARADEVTVSGNTSGSVTGVPPLTFTGNASFTGTTVLGIGSLSGTNNLGTFSLATSPVQTLSGSFTLNITFTAPAGINGGQSTVYTATIVGSVSPNVDQGGVNIHFASPTQTFTFSNATGRGTFSLTVADLFVESGRSANVTAGITGNQSPVPEPTTLLLLGTGVTGIAARLRYRSRNRKAKSA
jgi:PEP-CTERM motif